MRTNKGFTLIELLVVISIIALLIGILLPALGAARATARRMQSNTQIRGIHQAMVMFAQSNRDNFPGLTGGGNIVPADSGNGVNGGTDDYRNGNTGAHPGRRYAIMLNGNFFTEDYILSPVDTSKKEVADDKGVGQDDNVTDENYSYAMLDIREDGSGDAVDAQRTNEWSQTLNTQAIAISDRNTGADSDGDVSSVHTEKDSGDWRGGVARNDNSVAFETTHVLTTRYGSAQINEGDDNIFVPDDGHSPGNAHMVYESASKADAS